MLVLGFEPYGTHAVNPSERLVGALDGRRVAGCAVRGEVLGVRFGSLRERLEAVLDEHRPSAVIAFGLRPGERAVCLERVAFNRNDFPIADNAGARERGPVRPGEPDRRAVTLPVEAIRAALLASGIPARCSDDAGRFLCNALMYESLSWAERSERVPPTGFVHLPCLPGQVASMLSAVGGEGTRAREEDAALASMSLGLMIEAAEIAIATTAATVG